MKRFILFLFCLIISELVITTTVLAQESSNAKYARLAYTPPEKPLIVKAQHPEFILKLKSNPTTGFSWFLSKYNTKLVKPIAYQYVPAKSNLMGAGGYEILEFKLKKIAFKVPTTTQISLIYARAWQKKTTSPVDFRIFTQAVNSVHNH